MQLMSNRLELYAKTAELLEALTAAGHKHCNISLKNILYKEKTDTWEIENTVEPNNAEFVPVLTGFESQTKLGDLCPYPKSQMEGIIKEGYPMIMMMATILDQTELWDLGLVLLELETRIIDKIMNANELIHENDIHSNPTIISLLQEFNSDDRFEIYKGVIQPINIFQRIRDINQYLRSAIIDHSDETIERRVSLKESQEELKATIEFLLNVMRELWKTILHDKQNKGQELVSAYQSGIDQFKALILQMADLSLSAGEIVTGIRGINEGVKAAEVNLRDRMLDQKISITKGSILTV